MDETTIAAIFGVIIAAVFWIVTQWNVIRVGQKIKDFQSEARSHADVLISEKFQTMEALIDRKIKELPMPDIPKPNYSEIRLLVREEIERIPMPELPTIPPMPDLESLRSAILSDLNQQLNLMMPAISETVQTGIKDELKAIKAAETRKLGQELQQYGLAIDELGGAMKDELMAKATDGMSPVQMAAMNFLQKKPSPAWAEENPGGAAFLDFAKMIAIQYAQGDGLGDLSMSKPINAKKAIASSNSAKSGIYG